MVLLTKYFLLLTALSVVCLCVRLPAAQAQCDTTTPNDGLCLRDGTEPGYSAAELTSWLETLDTADRAATTTLRGRVILSTSGESTTGEVVEATDSRLSNARTPTGSASGDLTGTYPSPTIGADKILESHLKVVDTAVDEECLTRETSTGDFEWQPCASAGGYATIQDETIPLNTQTVINFTGAGVTCVDNAGATRTDCTIAGGGGSGTITAVGSCTTGDCGAAGGTDIFPGLLYEGTADNFETTWAVTDPDADRVQTFPNASGTFILKDGNNDLIGTIRDINLRKILPTVGTTQFLQAGTSIDCSTGFWVQVCGSTDGVACSAAVDLTIDPQITAGTKDGQICILLGADTTNTVTLDDGTGVRLREQRVLGTDGDGFAEAIWLRWKEANTLWEEVIPKGVQLGSTESLQITHDASGANPEIDVGTNGLVFSDLTSATKALKLCNADESVCGRCWVDATEGFKCDTNPASNPTVQIPDTLDYFLKDSAGANIIAVDEATRVVSLPDSTLLDLSAINASSQTEGFKWPQTAAPAPTAEGLCAWDTDDNQLKCGDGATTTTIGAGGATITTLHSFRPQQNEPPAAAFATLDTRNSHPVLDFDPATAEAAVFSDILNRGYSGGNILVDIWFACMTNTTAGEEVVWEAQWADLTAEDLDTADPFAAIQEASPATCSTTAGVMTKATITFTSSQIDAVIAGDPFQLKVLRQTADAADDLDTLDAEVRLVEVRQ